MNSKGFPIRDYMTPAPFTIESNTPLKTAQEVMKEYHVKHLPVISGSKVMGILSERGLNVALSLEDFEKYVARDVMLPNPYVVDPQTPFLKILRAMAEETYGCAVVQEDGKLVGIFTMVDACRVLGDFLEKAFSS